MNSFEPQARWKGREVLDAGHGGDLDRAAAVYEFGHKLPRDQAEDKAYQDYLRDQRRQGAAHHYQSMLAANATGDTEGARAYNLLYSVHARELGLNPSAPVADDIRSLMDAAANKPGRRFMSHPSDSLPLLRAESLLALTDVAGPAQTITPAPLSAPEELLLLTKMLVVIQNLQKTRFSQLEVDEGDRPTQHQRQPEGPGRRFSNLEHGDGPPQPPAASPSSPMSSGPATIPLSRGSRFVCPACFRLGRVAPTRSWTVHGCPACKTNLLPADSQGRPVHPTLRNGLPMSSQELVAAGLPDNELDDDDDDDDDV